MAARQARKDHRGQGEGRRGGDVGLGVPERDYGRKRKPPKRFEVETRDEANELKAALKLSLLQHEAPVPTILPEVPTIT